MTILSAADLQAIRAVVREEIDACIIPLENDVKEVYTMLAKHKIFAE